MANQPYTKFQAATDIGHAMLMNELENNLKSFLDWCFIGIGAFVNVTIPTNSSFGGSFSTLKLSSDPNYTAGTVWESIRKDWIWETGNSYNGTSPIQISGAYVNNQFYPTNDATWGHYYDYANGRVVFNNPVPTSSGVSLNYSYRLFQVYVSDKADWFYSEQYSSFKPGDGTWNNSTHASGDYYNPPQHRVQFPAIVIECVPDTNYKPYELGNNVYFKGQDVLFNIVSDTRWARNKLMDILKEEKGHNIKLYNTYAVNQAGMAPLDINGMLVNPTGMYPNLVDNFKWQLCYFKDFSISDVEAINPRLYEGKVRIQMEVL